MKKPIRILIFDFDGTIADTKSTYYNAMLPELKKYKVGHKELEFAIDLGLTLEETIRKIGFSFLHSKILKRRIMKQLKKNINKIKKCRKIAAIKKLKIKKILVSNSSKSFIMPILNHLKIEKYFDEIYGAEDFENKKEFIESYLKKNKIQKKNCFYIGDRVADVELARRVRCRSIIITGRCAWDSRKEIMNENPDFVVSDLGKIKKIIQTQKSSF